MKGGQVMKYLLAGVGSRLLCLFVIATALFVAGCAQTGVVSVTEVIQPEIEDHITLGPGDELDMKFFYNPELNDVQTVRPDGRITLQLVGDVMAHGRTPADLQKELRTRYGRLLEKPEVTVIVRTLNSRVVYVGGAVQQSGRLSMPGRLTVLSAILQAGGLDNVNADASEVLVVRHTDGKRIVTSLDLRAAIKGDEYNTFYLEPQDIVLVPRSTVVAVNQWIEQHINRMVPGVGFTYSRRSGSGRSTIGVDMSP